MKIVRQGVKRVAEPVSQRINRSVRPTVSITQVLQERANRAVANNTAKFYFGGGMDYTFDVSQIRVALRLPYRRCELHTEDDRWAVVGLTQMPDGSIKMKVKRPKVVDVHMTISFELSRRRVKAVRVMSDDKTPSSVLADYLMYSQAVLSLLHSLWLYPRAFPRVGAGRSFSLGREQRTDNSYNVVVITIPRVKTVSEELGGTHASPREHDREGHWRKVRGKKHPVWVRATKVNPGTKGKISKHYVVKSLPKSR